MAAFGRGTWLDVPYTCHSRIAKYVKGLVLKRNLEVSSVYTKVVSVMGGYYRVTASKGGGGKVHLSYIGKIEDITTEDAIELGIALIDAASYLDGNGPRTG